MRGMGERLHDEARAHGIHPPTHSGGKQLAYWRRHEEEPPELVRGLLRLAAVCPRKRRKPAVPKQNVKSGGKWEEGEVDEELHNAGDGKREGCRGYEMDEE